MPMKRMVQYGRKLIDEAPSWIRAGAGEDLLKAFGAHIDLLADSFVYAAKTRFASEKGQNLGLVGENRGLQRGFQESDDSYSERLRVWRAEHSRRGTGVALLNQVRIAMGTSIQNTRLVYRNGVKYTLYPNGTVLRSNTTEFSANGPAEQWARWWLIVDGTILDSSVIQSLRIITQEWNAAHCIGQVRILNGDRFWNSSKAWNTADTWNSNNQSLVWTVVG